ncbi:catalase, partial [Pedobacter sp.]|uniref:catalase n=1 Tax=Pedobacter sp. TaxID=1411316 RepID=UPI003C36A7E7
GPRGALLLQDFILHEKLARFNRERIPERVVHAKGSGAYGTFTVTGDITPFSKARLFEKIGKKTRLFLRFSTVGGEKGSADTERDPRGFAVKFYTEEGNWDLVGNNTPIFFVKDPKKFPDFIHTQKRDPFTNCKNAAMTWDFFSLNPESMHQVLFLHSDRGTPFGFRHMHGFGSHTYSLINAENEICYVKFHFKTMQGIKNFSATQADEMRLQDPDFAQRDLLESIQRGDFPKWRLCVQLMDKSEAYSLKFNPFDITKTWSQKDFPLMQIGTIELHENPRNYFAEVEQAAFTPSNIVNGIGFSPDKMLQGRIFAYPDAQRYRLGVNYEQIPVNKCPFSVNNYHRDGSMRVDGNGEETVNYYPNSFDGPYADPLFQRPAEQLNAVVADWFNRNEVGEDDHYSQPGKFYRDVLSPIEKEALCLNIVKSMQKIQGPMTEDIINRQLCHFFRTDFDLGKRIAKGLDINIAFP